jgi:hypothetical protein
MRSMAAGAVRSTVGGLLTDDVITEVKTNRCDTLFPRSDVSTTLMLNVDFRDVTRCSGQFNISDVSKESSAFTYKGW